MAKNGGARPGAGRPKGSLSVKSKMRLAYQEQFIKFVNKNKKKIFEAQLKLALGVFIPVNHPITGQLIDVAQKAPDGMTLSWMQEQIFGRAPQKIEIEADVNESIEAKLSPESLAALNTAIGYVLPKNSNTPSPRKN